MVRRVSGTSLPLLPFIVLTASFLSAELLNPDLWPTAARGENIFSATPMLNDRPLLTDFLAGTSFMLRRLSRKPSAESSRSFSSLISVALVTTALTSTELNEQLDDLLAISMPSTHSQLLERLTPVQLRLGTFVSYCFDAPKLSRVCARLGPISPVRFRYSISFFARSIHRRNSNERALNEETPGLACQLKLSPADAAGSYQTRHVINKGGN